MACKTTVNLNMYYLDLSIQLPVGQSHGMPKYFLLQDMLRSRS